MPTLYRPDKYHVCVGGDSSVALCTAWNQPDTIFQHSKLVQEKTALVGSLYSRHGVNIILRNLALNPHIRTLILWGNGTLSNTKFGISGSSLLKTVWQNGVDDDHRVRDTQLVLENEIAPTVIERMRQNVTLLDMSANDFSEVESAIAQHSSQTFTAYMTPTAFPEPQEQRIETFPSEKVGWLVRGRTILDAWSRVVERIMRHGTIKGSQYGYRQRELVGVQWIVEHDDPEALDLSLAAAWPQELRELVGADAPSLKEYQRHFLSPDLPDGMTYTYGNRIFAYTSAGQTIDQVSAIIIRQLKQAIDSRRTAITLLIPVFDQDSKEPPCLTQLQALHSEGKIHLLASFRSHDIFRAAISNISGLRLVQKNIASELQAGLGQLSIASNSAHIYEQDWDQALNLVRCHFWEREPSGNFDAEQQSDPRGNVLISLCAGKICATIQSGEGQELLRLEDATAKQLAKKIAHLDLLSRADHLLDIGQELQKAEIALRQNMAYTQDRPLIFNVMGYPETVSNNTQQA